MSSTRPPGPPSAQGDEAALLPINERVTRILVENHRQFRVFLAKRVGSEQMAEDLLQSGLRKALESPPRNEEEKSVVAWFYRVLKNNLIDHYRSQATDERKHAELLAALETEGRTQERSPDDLEAAVCACMAGLLPALKPEYADLIRRIDLGGEAPARVSQDLGINENNLGVRLHRARQALKTSLKLACGTCTEHGCLDCTCT